MAKSEQQRQKKLAKKRTKDAVNRRALVQHRNEMASLQGQMKHAGRFPIHGCWINKTLLDDQRFGYIMVARAIGEGQLAMAALLIDGKCLGLKDAMGRTMSPSDLEGVIEDMGGYEAFTRVDASFAKKLADDSIAYAAAAGLSPHPDYRKVVGIWGDVDASQCDQQFEFGENGKYAFIAGPLDSQARQMAIIAQLAKTIGLDRFTYVPFLDDGSDR